MYSRPLLAKEPQRCARIFDSEAPLRDHCRVGRDRLVVGINTKSRGSQPSARVGETRLSDALAKEVSGGTVEATQMRGNQHGSWSGCQGNKLAQVKNECKANRDSQLEIDNISLLCGNTALP